jgi:hypothetical protein
MKKMSIMGNSQLGGQANGRLPNSGLFAARQGGPARLPSPN